MSIRRLLTEGAVRASDKRARFIGLEAYEAAGGAVLRDLFQGDDGGWLQDVALVDRLVAERLEREAEAVRAEGWSWIEVAPDFPYGHSFGLRQLRGEAVAADRRRRKPSARRLQAEYDRLEEAHADRRGSARGGGSAAGRDRGRRSPRSTTGPVSFDPAEIARAGAFVSIDSEGRLRVERGYVRPEDELPIAPSRAGRRATDSGDGDRTSRTGVAMAMRVESGRRGRCSGPEPRRSRRRTTASSRFPTGC